MHRNVATLILSLGLVLGSTLSAQAAVDLNTATLSELETVKGLGPAKARAIVEYRQKNGPFKNLNDLDKVRGFGQASIKKLASELTVGSGPKTEKH